MRIRSRGLLRTVAEGTAGAVGDEFLQCLVRHLALAFDAKFAFVAEASDSTGEHVRVISGWYDGDWMDEPFEYDTRGKPCALVVERPVVAFPEELTSRFPEAQPAIDALSIRVLPEDGALLVEIADDGRGGADATAGTGLRGLSDRIDALGGRFDVDSPAGAGTRVRASLPLGA